MPTMKTLTIGGTTWDIEGGVTSVNGQTGAVVLDAEDVGAATEQDIADAIIQVLPVDSASGSIASFPDGYPAPVEALSVQITPVQSGSGTPAPDNIRPITGWSEAQVWCESTHDTSADPKVTIDLSGTRYGGTLDVLTGVLTVTHVYTSGKVQNLPTAAASYTNISYGQIFKPNDSKNVGNTAVHGLLSSMYAPKVGHTWDSADHVGEFLTGATYNGFWIGFPYGTTLAEMQTATENHQLVYELASPLSVQLNPATLTTLLGDNNIWANCGDVAVSYRADIQRYIEKKLS